MKTKFFQNILAITAVAIPMFVIAQGQFKVRNDHFIQIGYTNYNALTFGQCAGRPECAEYNRGNFSLEYLSSQESTITGFNVWKPWPTSNNANYLLFIRDNGNTGIGNSGDASYKLTVNGSVKATSFYSTSDERFKRNLKSIESALESINKVNTYRYYYIETEKPKDDSLSVNVLKKDNPYQFDDKEHFGVKAGELKKVFPQLVTADDQGYLNVNYVELVPVLIKAVQEQDAKIAELTEKIERLETQAAIFNAPLLLPVTNEEELSQSASNTNTLYQNAPNPFNQSTKIKYFLSENANNAKICIYDLNGLQLKCFNLTGIGEGAVEVQASNLKPGIYLYSLLVNNQIVDTKRMLLTE